MNILITGASRGIGAAVAKKFTADNEHQIILMSRDKEKLENVREDCIKINNKVRLHVIPTDLTIFPELEKSVNKILKITSSIDILINNAGLSLRKPFEKISSEEAERMMKVNFHGPFNLIRLLLPALLKSGHAHVVNISSMGGFQGSVKFKGMSCYGATKAAIASLTESLSSEFEDRGLSFNCLALGAVQTDMFSEVFPEFKAPMNPDDIAEFIVYFALNVHKFLRGKIIPVSLSSP